MYYYVNRKYKICKSLIPLDMEKHHLMATFLNENEAEEYAVRIQLREIAQELNNGLSIDWKVVEQPKYCLETSNNIITQSTRVLYKEDVVYCLSDKYCKVATDKIGKKRLLRYLINF